VSAQPQLLPSPAEASDDPGGSMAALVGAIPLVRDAHNSSDGATVVLVLDPLIVAARAEQQGLRDRSLKAAATSQRVQELLRRKILEWDQRRRGGAVITRCVLVGCGGAVLATFGVECDE
jgi:hypothetical protein